MSKNEIRFTVHENLGVVLINPNLIWSQNLRLCFRSLENLGVFQIQHGKPVFQNPDVTRRELGFRCKSR